MISIWGLFHKFFSKGNYDVKVDGQEENFDENIIKIPAANLSNFISEPASIVMEKIFAGRKTEVSLADLKTLNDTGDIIKVSYNSKVLENSVEIVKTLNCADSSDITLKSVEMDFEGNILTCKYEDITWIRDTEVNKYNYTYCFSLFLFFFLYNMFLYNQWLVFLLESPGATLQHPLTSFLQYCAVSRGWENTFKQASSSYINLQIFRVKLKINWLVVDLSWPYFCLKIWHE